MDKSRTFQVGGAASQEAGGPSSLPPSSDSSLALSEVAATAVARPNTQPVMSASHTALDRTAVKRDEQTTSHNGADERTVIVGDLSYCGPHPVNVGADIKWDDLEGGDEAAITSFFEKFGTPVCTQVILGGSMKKDNQQQRNTQNSEMEQRKKVSLRGAAGVASPIAGSVAGPVVRTMEALTGVSGSIQLQSNQSAQITDKSDRKDEDDDLDTVFVLRGGEIPRCHADINADTWAESIRREPYCLEYTFTPLEHLLPDQYRMLVTRAVKQYRQMLAAAEVQRSQPPPVPDAATAETVRSSLSAVSSPSSQWKGRWMHVTQDHYIWTVAVLAVAFAVGTLNSPFLLTVSAFLLTQLFSLVQNNLLARVLPASLVKSCFVRKDVLKAASLGQVDSSPSSSSSR